MTQEQAQKVLDELNEVRPEMLNDEAKELFGAIMKIADERDELRKVIRKQDLEISSLKQIHDYDVQMIDDVKGKAVELYNRIDERDETIKKQKETIEYLRRSCDRKESKLIEAEQELVELDESKKIINLMAEMINNYDIDEDICRQMGRKENCNEFEDKAVCVECIKQHFRNKVKGKELEK